MVRKWALKPFIYDLKPQRDGLKCIEDLVSLVRVPENKISSLVMQMGHTS